MHKLLVLSAVLAPLCAASLLAQESAAPAPADAGTADVPLVAQARPADSTPSEEPRASVRAARALSRSAASPVPAPAATPTPAPRKRGFFGRLFGGKERATPTPIATPAPATPRPTRKQPPRKPATERTDAAPKKEDAPAATEKPEQKPAADAATKPDMEKPAEPAKPSEPAKPEQPTASEQPPQPETKPAPATPAPAKKGAKSKGAKSTPAPKAEAEAKPTKEQLALQKAMAGGDADAIEKAKYDEVKSRAVEDERVKELKQKADEAPTEEEGRRALRAYNKALFQKMRSLDSSIKERIDRMEAAVLKQLGGAGEE